MFGLQYGQIEYGSGTLTARTSAVGSLVMTGSVQAAAALTAQSIGTILMLGSFHYASVAVLPALTGTLVCLGSMLISLHLINSFLGTLLMAGCFPAHVDTFRWTPEDIVPTTFHALTQASSPFSAESQNPSPFIPRITRR